MMSKIRFAEAVLRASVVVALAACTLVGCRKEESPAPVVSEEIKNDKAFRQKLDTHRKAGNKLIQKRNEIGREMAALTEKIQARLKTTDQKLVDAELKKIPRWNELVADRAKAETQYAENRKILLALTRERLAPTAKNPKNPKNTLSK